MAFKSYHHVWLASHPHRTADWLAARLAEGFDVHHINGDHNDDTPDNLALIECADHMHLHGKPNFLRMSLMSRPRRIVIRRYSQRGQEYGRSIVAEYYAKIERGEIDGSKKPEGYPSAPAIDVDNFSGPELRRWRKAMGLTIAELAELLGSSSISVMRWEKVGAKKVIALACWSISHGIPPYHEDMDVIPLKVAATSLNIPEATG